MSVDTNNICEYFKDNFKASGINCFNKTTFKNKHECFLKTINEVFKLNISCEAYNQVVNGEGDESRKIKTIFSSSLQSLLIFHKVSKEHPIKINNIEYTSVFFEYRNKVIKSPSSMDVVLYNEDGDILFIESKLTEFLTSSTNDMSHKSTYVIGRGYFFNKNNSYYSSLGLTDEELKEIGIVYDANNIYDGKTQLVAIENNEYVYSEGIKQILSHLIGINNYKKGDYYVLSPKLVSKPRTISFITISNELPNLEKYVGNECKEINKQYHRHIDKLNTVLGLKEKYNFVNMTYQDLYKDNPEYFKGMDLVTLFYCLYGK